jgi:hypothetical protein
MRLPKTRLVLHPKYLLFRQAPFLLLLPPPSTFLTSQFEIAVEETQKNTVYAPDDRAAAGEEMSKLKAMYDGALNEQDPDVAAEIKKRIGSRIRELDEAIKGLEESAKLGD